MKKINYLIAVLVMSAFSWLTAGAVNYTIGVKADGCRLYEFQYEQDEQVKMTAMPKSGDCIFMRWDDGNTENPRMVTVTGNKTYTAIFGYIITAKSANDKYATVSGSGRYVTNSTATLIATPKPGFVFVRWDDGNTENPRTITVTQSKTFVAEFERKNSPGVDIYYEGDYVDLGLPSGNKWARCNVGAAYPWEYGDRFPWGETTPIQETITWSDYLDGRMTSGEDCGTDKDLLKDIYNISGTEYDAATVNMGGAWRMPTLSEYEELLRCCYLEITSNYYGSGTRGCIVYKAKDDADKGKCKYYGSSFTPAASYALTDVHIFLPIYENYWAANRDRLSVSKYSSAQAFVPFNVSSVNTSSFAYSDWYQDRVRISDFHVRAVEYTDFTVKVSVSMNDNGTVTPLGDSIVKFNEDIVLTATANPNYRFVSWNDGNTENPRTVKWEWATIKSKSFYPRFEGLPYTVTVNTANSDMGIVSGSGTYKYNTIASVSASPNAGYRFLKWSNGSTDNPMHVNVYCDTTFTAEFEMRRYDINIMANSPIMGIVNGAGAYSYNTIATLSAIPNPGYKFVKWSDGSTDNPRYVRVSSNKTYSAVFAEGAVHYEVQGEIETIDGVTIKPYETKAEFNWLSINNVAYYSLIIWEDEAQGKKVCTLTINAKGQLTNIDFTQSVNPQGSTLVSGLNFIVTGLEPSTMYSYTLDAKDAEDDVIETKHGTFTTMGASGIADITAAGINIYTEGRTIIVENATEAITVSDALGRVVGKDDAQIVPAETRKFPVPSSGVYVVKIGNRVASVLVR